MVTTRLDWDDGAYLLALLELHPGVKRRTRRARRALIEEMRRYDGDSSNRVSAGMRHHIDYWKARIPKERLKIQLEVKGPKLPPGSYRAKIVGVGGPPGLEGQFGVDAFQVCEIIKAEAVEQRQAKQARKDRLLVKRGTI